jgi:hypothetical protein
MDEMVSFYFVFCGGTDFISKSGKDLIFLEVELHRFLGEKLTKLGAVK